MRRFGPLLTMVLAGCASGRCARTTAPALDPLAREPAAPVQTLDRTLIFHRVRVDAEGAILPWSDHPAPFHQVADLGFRRFAEIPAADHGHPPYFAASMFEGASFSPGGWVHNPAGLAAMLVRSSIRWRAYSGDDAPLTKVRAFVDHILARGLTDETDAWSRVPYASSDSGQLDYQGGYDYAYCTNNEPCGRGDGFGILEPDKVGELGHALMLLFEATSEPRYLEAAKRNADALAKHVIPGDAKRSPWPFRVDAKTGTVVREPWGSNVIFAIALFDELDRIGAATEAHRHARALAWEWLLAYPLKDHTWQGYFEDIPIHLEPGTNPNQYSAGETARWLLAHPERDPHWRAHVESIVGWIAKTFANDDQGAEAISEQKADMAKMGSHTARFASILALLHEKTGDPNLRARAFRAFAWATYGTDPTGLVRVSPDEKEGYWFSDGYGDYMIHFLEGMAAVPAWAPAGEDHLLRSSSVVTSIAYAKTSIRYATFDASGVEELRLASTPARVDGGTWTARAAPDGDVWVQIRRDASRVVTITR